MVDSGDSLEDFLGGVMEVLPFLQASRAVSAFGRRE